MNFKMTAEDFDKWIVELRNPENQQGYGLLGSEEGYCCLGLYCAKVKGLDMLIPHPVVQSNPRYDSTEGYGNEYRDDPYPFNKEEELRSVGGVVTGPRELFDDIGYLNRATLSRLNDGNEDQAPYTFKQVADYLEAHRTEFVDE